jgi:glucose-1-phosphate adenylyltransferase
MNTKLGFQQILINEKTIGNPIYHHDLNNLRHNDWILLEHKPDVIVIAPSHILYVMDFKQVIDEHLKNKSDITLLYTHIRDGKKHFLDGEEVAIHDGFVSKIQPNQGMKDDLDVSMDTYIFSRQGLQHIFDKAKGLSATFGLKEVLKHLIHHDPKLVYAHAHTGYVRSFFDLGLYYDFSMEMLNYDLRKSVFLEDWPIYTVTNNTPPARYGPNAVVQNSMIANGAKIYGTVKNSIISRNVIIEEGARVENSIVFTNSHIGKDVHVTKAVIDKYCHIHHVKKLEGKDLPLYIRQGDHL